MARSVLEALIDADLDVALAADSGQWIDGSVMSQLAHLRVVLESRAGK
jgi:hypothetical protein